MSRHPMLAAIAATFIFSMPAVAQDHGHAGPDMGAHEQGEHGETGAAVTVGDLILTGTFARASLPSAPSAGGYVTVENRGTESDRLIDASSEFSDDVQIHEMSVVNDVMEMRRLDEGLEIPAGESVTLAPGGLHLMFLGLNQPFEEGSSVPVTLVFERAGEVEISLEVRAFGAGG